MIIYLFYLFINILRFGEVENFDGRRGRRYYADERKTKINVRKSFVSVNRKVDLFALFVFLLLPGIRRILN